MKLEYVIVVLCYNIKCNIQLMPRRTIYERPAQKYCLIHLLPFSLLKQ